MISGIQAHVEKLSTELEVLIPDCLDLDRREGWFMSNCPGPGRLEAAQHSGGRQHTLDEERREAGRKVLREWANAHGGPGLRMRMRDKPGGSFDSLLT
ncbi:hypothetical protein ACWEKT_39930 [Nocardia takedensis]